MNEQQNKDIHQLLIAVLLGEATPAEVAEVTTALAESAELRAERERLEATIGLVTEHLGSEPSLPVGTAEAILAQNASTESASAVRGTALKAAAVLFLTLGAWAVYRGTGGDAFVERRGNQSDLAIVEKAAAGGFAGPGSPGPPGSAMVVGIGGGAGGKFGGRSGGSAYLGVQYVPAPGGGDLRSIMDAATAGRGQWGSEGGSSDALGLKAGKQDFVGARVQDGKKEAISALRYADEPEGESDSTRAPALTAAERAAIIGERAEQVFHSCMRMPDEKPSQMYFRFWGDNAFEKTHLDHLSTFSVDVDTASYALARRTLMEDRLPERAQIRTEEFLNYFKPDVAAPVGVPFAIETELAPSLFGGREDRWLLRVAVRGREVSDFERKPVALTFVVDTSGSMRGGGRLEMVKNALLQLLMRLEGIDTVSIVSFNKEAHEVLPRTSALNRGIIENALLSLSPGGGTNAENGLLKGYAVALATLDPQASNRVVFLSDGIANMGQTDQDRINGEVKNFREQGILLNTIGVGMGGVNDNFLEQLADKGDGVCNYIDSPKEARRALVENFTGAFEAIARDVKIQVEFDELQVSRYRLLGYENRAIADADFRNDAVDAGEVGAGHQVVALYEVERSSGFAPGPLATVNLRWKAPKDAGDTGPERLTEIAQSAYARDASSSFRSASNGYRRSVLVAQFAEFLRRSTHAQGDSWETLLDEGRALDGVLGDADFTEFLALSAQARQLLGEAPTVLGPLEEAIEAYRRNHLREAELELAGEGSAVEVEMASLRGARKGLEDDIRLALDGELFR
ncbi:MAG: hypothetical protein CMK00_04565 [Planctomycetes bacterium]|nr:hypothetical protein [Planctomycetota bacterium]